MADFYREKDRNRKPARDYSLGFMIGVIVFTVLFVMIVIFIILPLLMHNWWGWLHGTGAIQTISVL